MHGERHHAERFNPGEGCELTSGRRAAHKSIFTYDRILDEAELVAHLRATDTVVLKVPGLRWQAIEREIERLGYGERFVVSATSGRNGDCCKIEASIRRSSIASVAENSGSDEA